MKTKSSALFTIFMLVKICMTVIHGKQNFSLKLHFIMNLIKILNPTFACGLYLYIKPLNKN